MAEIKNGGDGLEERNIVIIGGGTAGFAAGVYTSRAMLGAAAHHRGCTRRTTLIDT